ncbi:hypothetical protein GmHk_03G007802 [Glycine max]|nr:hypothetical protein GmHk_03G007802 [Glycine max]
MKVTDILLQLEKKQKWSCCLNNTHNTQQESDKIMRIKKDIEHKVLQISNVVGPRLHSRGTISNDAAKKEEKLVETSKRKPHEGHQPHARGLKLRGTSDNDAAKMEEKLETSKRKLHEGYQAHERDRRSTRYFEGYECDLPKGKHSRRSSRPKLSNRRKYS